MTTKTECFIACAYQFGDQYKDDVAIYTSKYSQRSNNSAGHFFGISNIMKTFLKQFNIQ